jgi:TrmH family RNA methyltransferase
VELHDLAARNQTPWHVVTAEVMAELADSVTPQGVVARCVSVVRGLDALTGDFVVVAAEIRDPGNAGSLIRVADAAGADAVVFAGDTVDPLNPKAVRASVGSHFHLPVIVERDLDAVFSALVAAGVTILAADGGGDAELFSTDLTGPVAWVMGNEAHGLPEEVRQLSSRLVSIPIHGAAESLNLATAAAVCLYETARQRHATVPVKG